MLVFITNNRNIKITNKDNDQMWHVKNISGDITGPFSSEQLSDMYIEGLIEEDDELWSKASGTWAKAWQCKGMFLSPEDDSSEYIDSSAPPPLPDEVDDSNYLDEIGMGVSGVEGDHVCPFCWRKFDLCDVMFIAQHSDLVGDDVLIDAGEMRRFVPRRFTPDGNAIDSGGVVCEKRACPVCHQHLSLHYFEMSPLYISLVGSPHSGKSVYLPSMLRILRERCRTEFNISFVDTEVEQNQWISESEHSIFNKGLLPGKTQIENDGRHYKEVTINDMPVLLTMPAFYAFKDERTHRSERIKKIRRTLVLHDNAGEHYHAGGDNASAPGIRHLLHSEAIMFLFDPTADSGFRRRYINAEDKQFIESDIQDQGSILMNAIQLIMRHNHNEKKGDKYDRPLIVMVAKADALGSSFNEILSADPFVVNDMYEHVLDMRLLLKISYQIRELIREYSPTVVSAVESMADDVIYMPVSALGHSPVAHNESEFVDLEKLSPKWVDVPILYILYRLGYLEGIKSIEPGILDEPKIINRSEDSITFVSPRTGLSDTIPSQYVDVKLRCPFSEKEFMIKSVGESV